MPEHLRPIPVPPRAEGDADRLDSWKEIAAFLRREVRTVQGWEKTEQLPIHRHRHSRQGSVYAFKSELAAWRQSRQGVFEAPIVAVRPTPSTRLAGLTVGRQKELNELRAALHDVAQGRGLMLCVTGEPGMGKTTLVEEFLGDLSEPCRVARGKCSERLAGTEAYLPWVESLESLLRHDDTRAVARLMKSTAPNWYVQVGEQASRISDASGILAATGPVSQERMKRELAGLLQALSLTQPLIVWLEDLHWADVSTIDLLVYVAGRFDNTRILVVGTYRPSDLLLSKHPFLQVRPDLQTRGLFREIPLEFLSHAEIERYLDLSFPGHRFPPDLAALIHARTEGSPLFMSDLVRYLRDRGVLQERDGWKLAGSLPDLEREMPQSVRAMVERKIAQLQEDDRGLLVAASAQGYEFDSAIVCEALGADPVIVEERLEQLDRIHSFVRRVDEREFPDGAVTLRYRFVHVLYQNALYASLQPTRRASLCGAVAKALLEHHGQEDAGVASQLAPLFEAARDFVRAASYYQKAAGNATSVFAYREAVELARRGLEQLNRLPSGSQNGGVELALQVTLGEPLQAWKGYASPEVEQTYLKAVKLAEDLGEDGQLGLALYGLGMSYLVQGEFAKAQQVGEQFLALGRKLGDLGLEITACGALEGARLHTGNFTGAVELFRHYEALLDRTSAPAPAVIHGTYGGTFVRTFGGWALWFLGYPDQARKQVDVALAEAKELKHIPSMASALAISALVYHFRRDVTKTRDLIGELLSLADEHGLGHYKAFGTVMHGWILACLQQPHEGLAELQKGREMFHANASRLHYPHFCALMAEAYCAIGSLEEGLAVCDDGIAESERTGGAYYQPEVFRLKGELLRLIDPSSAETHFRRALEVARRQKAKSTELRAAISLARLLPGSEARTLLTPIHDWFQEGLDTADLQEARTLLSDSAPSGRGSVNNCKL